MRNVTKWAILAVSMFALGFAACGKDDGDDDGSAGSGGNAQGGSGGNTNPGGNGGNTNPTGDCKGACENLIGCGIDMGSQTECEAMCDESWNSTQTGCVANAECTDEALVGCIYRDDCLAMCDHLYNACGVAFGDGQGGQLTEDDCAWECSYNTFTAEEMACISGAQCTEGGDNVPLVQACMQ